MKNCTDCVHADWKKTAAGKLHPSGDGECKKVVVLQKLPASFYYVNSPAISGGFINRRRTLKEDCIFFAYKKD
jgi:hypothetical protein